VGGGTGMICHGFKGGIGTSSRVTAAAAGGHTVGVLVQANHGRREQLRVNGTPVGERLDAIPQPELTAAGPGDGSIIVLVGAIYLVLVFMIQLLPVVPAVPITTTFAG